MAEDLTRRPPVRPISPRALATVVQALLHGLVMQVAADPAAFDLAEVVRLCQDLLAGWLWNGEARSEDPVPLRADKKQQSKLRVNHSRGNGRNEKPQRAGSPRPAAPRKVKGYP